MSPFKISVSLVAVAFALVTGCSSGPPSTEEGVAPSPSAKESVHSDWWVPQPVCTTLPETYCALDLGYQIRLSSYRTCPTISLPSGGYWTPGDPGAGMWATVYPEHPLGTIDTTSTGLYDSPYPFTSSDWVCSYAYENARNPDGTQYQSTPGVKRIDTSVICGTLQWTKIAYIVPTWSCNAGIGTSGARGCDTCRL